MDKEQLLYKYFSNSLSVEEEKKFQNLLETDIEFKEQFNFEKDLKRVVREDEKTKLKSKLQGFEKEIVQEKPVIQLSEASRKKSFNWSIAASVAILFGLGWFGYNTMTGTVYTDLYNANFEEYPNTVYSITRGDNQESIERSAFVAYESGDYETAITKLKQIPSEVKKGYIDFYLAQSQMNLENYTEAKTLFNETIKKNTDFVAESHWYLALISLLEKDEKMAVKKLKELTLAYDYNKEKALKLLKDLE